MAAPPETEDRRKGGDPGADDREMAAREPRPPLGSWKALYLLVIAALAVQVVVYTLLSRVTS